MVIRACLLAFLAALALPAADKKTVGYSKGENEDLMLTVSLYITPEDVKELVGSDLGAHYILADVKVEPKYGKEVTIDRDDFVLRTDKDGERTRPYMPSQIVGEGALVISSSGGGGIGSIGTGYPGDYPPGYPGGYPGGYPPMGGPPVMMPGSGVGMGTGEGTSDTKATVDKGNPQKVNPLKKALDERMLANGKTEKPVSGLLYFPMEKQKMKQLELVFGGVENRIRLRFKTP
jgi:hypothetical protein